MSMSKRVMSKKDLELLEWINEQYAVREDQLARLLGRSRASARRWASAMRDAGLCRREVLFRGEPACVWLTGPGAKLTEHRFRPWRGHLGKLDHIGAVGELRIHLSVQAPAASWVSERELLANQAAALFGRNGHKRSDAPHIPDAELILPSGERHALEVERTRKSQERLRAIIGELARRYDDVVYFCVDASVEGAVSAAIPKSAARKVHVRSLDEVLARVR